MNVLVVDNFSTVRRILRNLLAQNGYTNVDEAEDGKSALANLKGGGVGLVIAALQMEPMTGLQMLQELRADSKLKALPVILVAADNRVEMRVAAQTAGANGYLVKPFNAVTLKSAIDAALAGHR